MSTREPGLLESSTLAVEIGATAAATAPFVTSSVTPTPEREGGGPGDSVTGPNLRSQLAFERSSMPPPPLLTAAVATTVVAGSTSAPIHDSGAGQVKPSIFRDSTSPSTTEADVAGLSQPAGAKLSAGSFYVSQDMDPGTLRQIYIPKWNAMDYEQLLAEFKVGAARQACFNVEIRMRLEHELRGRQKLKERCALQAIRLRGQIANVEAAEAARVIELSDVKAKNVALDGQVADLEFAAASKEAELASSNSQVSELEATCSSLRNEVAGYNLFKEQVEAVQDEQVKTLSDRVAGIDADLMNLALHIDEEFYPCYLTTISGRRGALGRAIDKEMQGGLAAGVDHGKARRGLEEIAAYDPSTEAKFVSAINALRDVDFPLLAQLESQKDASMAVIMDLLRLEGPAAETPEASQLQPSFEQLTVPIL
ncbi:hypothetical protein Tco_0576258 [Tanacetum coccineum]